MCQPDSLVPLTPLSSLTHGRAQGIPTVLLVSRLYHYANITPGVAPLLRSAGSSERAPVAPARRGVRIPYGPSFLAWLHGKPHGCVGHVCHAGLGCPSRATPRATPGIPLVLGRAVDHNCAPAARGTGGVSRRKRGSIDASDGGSRASNHLCEGSTFARRNARGGGVRGRAWGRSVGSGRSLARSRPRSISTARSRFATLPARTVSA